MGKNLMKEVANLLGLELEEEFYINGINRPYKFNHNGLYFEDSNSEWQESTYLAYLIKGEMTIVKDIKPILNQQEKEYLSAVIKPFRDRVKSIVKECYSHELITIWFDDSYMQFPYFIENTMYKGMELDKGYTLEELDL